MSTSTYTYGTDAQSTSEHQDIKFVRKCAKRYLDGEETMFITNHAFQRASERQILIDDAAETICDKYFVEFQPARVHQHDSRVLFYSGHQTAIITVSTLSDIMQQKITLITVEHKDTTIWKDKDAYIERI